MDNDREVQRGNRYIQFIHIFSSYNSDGLSLMDVAVLTNNTEMVKLLIQHGAREGTECKFLVSLFHLSVTEIFLVVLLTVVVFVRSFGNQMAARNR